MVIGPGSLLDGRYRLAALLGVGASSEVFGATDERDGTSCAVKLLRADFGADRAQRERFEREASAAASLPGAPIARLLCAAMDRRRPYLVLERLAGEDLASRARREGPLGLTEVVGLLEQAGGALATIHGAGLVHRDIKPEHLFLTRSDDGRACVKLLDLGIAKLVATGASARTTANHGTPVYMPPEQLRGDGDIDARADVYSLAHCAFTLLTGQPYWSEDLAAARTIGRFYRAVLRGPIEPPSERARRWGVELPAGFDDWLRRGGAPERADRPAAVAGLVAELWAAAAG
jgi:serine/threonine-protein kinase